MLSTKYTKLYLVDFSHLTLPPLINTTDIHFNIFGEQNAQLMRLWHFIWLFISVFLLTLVRCDMSNFMRSFTLFCRMAFDNVKIGGGSYKSVAVLAALCLS